MQGWLALRWVGVAQKSCVVHGELGNKETGRRGVGKVSEVAPKVKLP